MGRRDASLRLNVDGSGPRFAAAQWSGCIDEPMYTAVRIVKMNACRKLTRISKPVIATSNANENGRMTTVTLAAKSAAHSVANVTRIKWPASMLAKRRTISEKGRTRNVEMNSIG